MQKIIGRLPWPVPVKLTDRAGLGKLPAKQLLPSLPPVSTNAGLVSSSGIAAAVSDFSWEAWSLMSSL